jgi:photosystem II PsbX protein
MSFGTVTKLDMIEEPLGNCSFAQQGNSFMTASLSNFLWSLVAGAVVLGALLGAIIFVSQKDKVRRR